MAVAMPSGKRPLQLNASTAQLWARLRSDSPAWFPETPAGCSHFLLEGVQRPPPGSTHHQGPLHTGKLSVPPEETSSFNAYVAAAATNDHMLYVHEIATPIRPFFVDGDGNEPVTVKFVTLLRDVVRAAGLSTGLEASAAMAELQMPTLAEATMEIVELMEKRPVDPATKTWTWNDAFETALDPDLRVDVGTLDSPLLRLPQPLVLVFTTLFEMAVIKLMDPVLRTFYADDTKDQVFRANALCSYNHTTRKPTLAHSFKGDVPSVKFGMHVVYHWLKVDSETSLWLWQGLVDKFASDFPATPGKQTPAEWWGIFFDSSQFHSPVGGLRMPFCLKAAACKSCRPDTRRSCATCLGSGKIHDDRYYGPLCVIDKRELNQTVWMQRMFRAPSFMVSVVSLRCMPGTQLTKGLSLVGKREPANMLARHRERLERNVGKSAASRTVRKLAEHHKIDPESPRMCSLIDAVNSFDETVPERAKPKPTLRIPLMDTDPRCQAVKRALPSMLEAYFHRSCADIQVRSVTLVLDRPKGEPMYLTITVRGPGGCRCFNREVDTFDSEIAEDLPVALRGRKVDDVDGIPGRHTNSSNSVYYRIHRDGTITQLCNNPQSKATRRSAQKHGEGAMAACVNSKGETRQIERPRHDNILRDLFYTPQEQRDKYNYHQEIVNNVAALSRRLKKAKKQSGPAGAAVTCMIGAFDTYKEDVEQAVSRHQRIGGANSGIALTTEDVWIDTESESSNSGFGFPLSRSQ